VAYFWATSFGKKFTGGEDIAAARSGTEKALSRWRISLPLRSVRLEPTVLLHARSRQQPAATNSVGFRQSLIDVRLAPTSGAKADISNRRFVPIGDMCSAAAKRLGGFEVGHERSAL